MGFYTAISCQPKDKLTDISVDCVVSMPYRSVRKKKERNRKYYACNSEQLRKKYAGLLLNSIKHAKSIQLEGPLSLTFKRQPIPVCKGFLIPVNGEGKCVVARAPP